MTTSSNGGNLLVTGPLCADFTGHRRIPPTKASDTELQWVYMFFCGLRLKKRLSKQLWGWWFVTTSRSLWRHCNVNWCQCITIKLTSRRRSTDLYSVQWVEAVVSKSLMCPKCGLPIPLPTKPHPITAQNTDSTIAVSAFLCNHFNLLDFDKCMFQATNCMMIFSITGWFILKKVIV